MQIAPADLLRKPHAGHEYALAPRNVYWEMTIACDLSCRHCRANAIPTRDPMELSTDQAKELIRGVKELGSMLILTGGDPMKRADLFELIDYARSLHVPVGITPATTPLLTREAIHGFHKHGVAALGISIDGGTVRTHDDFRGVHGTLDRAFSALQWAREVSLPVQINTAVTRQTLPELPHLYERLKNEAYPPVKRWSLFLLVPTGRGAVEDMPTPEQVEELFEWSYKTAKEAPFHVGTVEAPQYRRFLIQQKVREGVTVDALMKDGKRNGFGVRDGNGVIFISFKGEVYPAGFLPDPLLGNVKEASLPDIYRNSPDLARLRDMDQLGGKCGQCEYRWVCGGSRARAFGMTGDAMATDPACVYEPAVA